MDQTLNAIFDSCEGPKRRDFGNDARHHLTRSIALFDGVPRVNLSPFDRERDLLLLFIDAQNLNLDLLANMQDLAGVTDVAPCQLTDMNQSVGSSQIHEGSEIGEAANYTLTYFAGFEFCEQFFATVQFFSTPQFFNTTTRPLRHSVLPCDKQVFETATHCRHIHP